MKNGLDEFDHTRRRFVLGAASLVGGAGIAATTIPFLSAWWPNAKAIAAGEPTECDVSKLSPGQQVIVAWRGKPVLVVRRSKEMLEQLPKLRTQLRDPDSKVAQQPSYTQNEYRSISPEYVVLVGICTHLGCAPKYRPVIGSVEANWPGGFYCPCHGSKFDLAGRVFQGVPAPVNLEVPPYKFITNQRLMIGLDPD